MKNNPISAYISNFRQRESERIDRLIMGDIIRNETKTDSAASSAVDAIVMPRTMEEAKELNLSGWNIRCNYCGSYGARWIPNARPGWGNLCLCEQHENEYDEEMRRHKKELKRLRTINFEQKRV